MQIQPLSPLYVTSARYGPSHNPSVAQDVTHSLRSHIGMQPYYSNNGQMNAIFGDPYPGAQKQLQVTFFYNGAGPMTMVFHEHQPWQLPGAIQMQPAHGVRILQAFYGPVNEPHRAVDVTPTVQSRATPGFASNGQHHHIFGDPFPNILKSLRVVYAENGQTLQASANDGVPLNVPQFHQPPQQQVFVQQPPAPYYGGNVTTTVYTQQPVYAPPPQPVYAPPVHYVAPTPAPIVVQFGGGGGGGGGGPRFHVMNASYAPASNPRQGVDVTRQFQAVASPHGIHTDGRHHVTAGFDPFPNVVKVLTLTYKKHGVKHVDKFSDGVPINISC